MSLFCKLPHLDYICAVALLANKDEYNFEHFSNATDSRML